MFATDLKSLLEDFCRLFAFEEKFGPYGGSIFSSENDVDPQPVAYPSIKQISDDTQGWKAEQKRFGAGGGDHRGSEYHGRDDDGVDHTAGGNLSVAFPIKSTTGRWMFTTVP